MHIYCLSTTGNPKDLSMFVARTELFEKLLSKDFLHGIKYSLHRGTYLGDICQLAD